MDESISLRRFRWPLSGRSAISRLSVSGVGGSPC